MKGEESVTEESPIPLAGDLRLHSTQTQSRLTSYPDLWTPQLQSQQAFHHCINTSVSSMPLHAFATAALPIWNSFSHCPCLLNFQGPFKSQVKNQFPGDIHSHLT